MTSSYDLPEGMVQLPEGMSIEEAHRLIQAGMRAREDVAEAPFSVADIPPDADEPEPAPTREFRSFPSFAELNEIAARASRRSGETVPPINVYEEAMGHVPQEGLIAFIRALDAELHFEAHRRGWCGDYERVIAMINHRLGLTMLQPRAPQQRPATYDLVVTYRVDPDYSPPTQGEMDDLLTQHAGDYGESLSITAFNITRRP